MNDFNTFLKSMSAASGSALEIPSSEDIKRKIMAEKTREEPVVQRPDPETSRQPVQSSSPQMLREETIQKVYETTAAIMKSLRQVFPDKTERDYAYASICEAIMKLSGKQSFQQPVNQPIRRTPVMMQTQDGLVESDYQAGGFIPRVNNLEGMSIDMSEYHSQLNQNMNEDLEGYSRALDIKPNQGLTGISEQDINELKALAGL